MMIPKDKLYHFITGFLIASAVRSNELHIKYNELKAEVNAAQIVEEVNSIQWTED